MVNLFIGVTDYKWFAFLSGMPKPEEVNFWQPGGRTTFRALKSGELFLFKLHSPRNFIVGGGVFAHSDILLASVAWEAFGISATIDDALGITVPPVVAIVAAAASERRA